VNNTQGYAEAYKDVIHEDAIKIGSATKAPDYCFRIGGARKFFLEAKKPSIDIKGDPGPAYQLRRYAWSAKLPLSILSDFQELAVYDCRIRPVLGDKSSTARVKFYSYTDYIEKWDEIAAIFSREAVLKGSFDKFADSAKLKKGTTQVDDAFLAEIESWRDDLAQNIAMRNPHLDGRELNFAVQITIDRIIFLRICEDRGIERYGELQSLLNGQNVYERLLVLFRKADDRYNSGLFHFNREKDRPDSPDELTPKLSIDDKILKDIIKRQYYPESPYEFSVLPAEILGQVYEQFLGKVITLTAGHRAKVEEKPEVKKAGGVFYTPSYIVDYIVENTVGKLVEGKTPKEVEKIKILDPACGSGSFLLGAFQFLLDWHLKWYLSNDPQKWARAKNPPICATQEPRNKSFATEGTENTEIKKDFRNYYKLTRDCRKRILLNNLFGVDIDSQAVEVTKLSLLLKVLEGEKELNLFAKERALPDLEQNIKCGNSLIGPDFYNGHQLTLFDEEQQYKINAFDWKKEFKEILTRKNPGFDAVIGNPPYVRVRFFKEIYPEQINYLESHYQCATHVWDVYMLFFEKAYLLTKNEGLFGFIVPIQTLHQPNCESVRRLLLEKTAVSSVVDLSNLKVFHGAIVKNCILICKNAHMIKNNIQAVQPDSSELLFTAKIRKWPQKAILQNPNLSLKVDLMSPKRTLCEKLKSRSWLLKEICYSTFGLRSCAKGVGQGGKDRLITTASKARHAKPYLEGREIGRYVMSPQERFIRYIPDEMYSPRRPSLFESKKIVSQSMLSKKRLVATLDTERHYVEQSLICIIPHGVLTDKKSPQEIPLEFILGILNSKLESFYFSTYIIDYSLGGGLIHATPGSHDKLLIPQSSSKEIRKITDLVLQIISLHKKLAAAKTPNDKTRLERQITATDDQIDRLVYELYGLTEEEVKLVEGAGN
jgi:type I restriction-modification system DNA methylase subunit